MEPCNTAYLDIRLSTAPGRIWRKVCLIDVETRLGRPEAGEPGVNLEYLWVARKHALIVREGTGEAITYVLQNWRGREGIRLYERILQPGDRDILRHGYVFHIPGVLAAATDPHFVITFCTDATTCLSIKFGQPPYISIFGQLVEFSPQEYTLLKYLYMHNNEICLYRDIIAYIWTLKLRIPEKKRYLEKLDTDLVEFSNRRKALDVLAHDVREKIRQASDGVTLIETIRGEGFCLRT